MEEWKTELDFIHWVNKPGFLAPDKKESLDAIAAKTYMDIEGNDQPYLTEEEFANFSVVKGNLTDE